MSVYGLFDDEGQIEGDFTTRDEAETARRTRYDADDDLRIEECCHDHPEEPRAACCLCDADEE